MIEDSKPDFNRVEPAAVFWGRDKPNPVGRFTQVCLPRRHILENTPLAFLPEILGIAEKCGYLSNQCFALVGIELVAKDDETCLGVRLDEAVEMRGKICFGSRLGNGGGEELACGQMNVASEDLGPMPDGVELPTLPTPWPHWQRLAVPFQSLDARFLVDADHMSALRVLFLSCGVQVTDSRGLFGERRPVVNVRVLPGAAPVRLERGFLLKSGSHAHGR